MYVNGIDSTRKNQYDETQASLEETREDAAEKQEQKDTVKTAENPFASDSENHSEKASSPDVSQEISNTKNSTGTTSPIKAGSQNKAGSAELQRELTGSIEDKPIGDSFEKSADLHTKPHHITREEARLRAQRAYDAMTGKISEDDKDASFMAEIFSDCVSVENEEDFVEAFTQYQLDMQEAHTREERIQIGKEFTKKTRLKIQDDVLKQKFLEHIRQNNISREVAEKEFRRFSKTMRYFLDVRLELARDEEEKEISVDNHAEDIEQAHEDLLKMLEDIIPENMTEAQVKELLESVNCYGEAHKKEILEVLRSGHFSDKFKNIINDKIEQILERNSQKTQEFIVHFFDTPKGRLIRNAFRATVREMINARKEYKAAQAETEKTKELVKEAQKESQAAMEDAKAKTAEAKNLVADAVKLSSSQMTKVDFDNAKFKHALKSISPKAARQLDEAKENEKKAYWAEWDANSEKRLAQNREKIAMMNLALAKMKLEAFMAKISAFAGM